MSATAMLILIADPDDIARAFLVDNLTADGYDVRAVRDHHSALAELEQGDVDLVLADVNGHTLALVDAVRNAETPILGAAPDLPVIALTAYAEELNRVRLLERGSDDVIVKPFSYPELRARIAAVLRRSVPPQPRPVVIGGDLRIDLHRRYVTVRDEPVALTDTEYRLLATLASDPTRVFTRVELLRTVWGHPANARTRVLDSFAHRLRTKLADATHPVVSNIWGVGLQLLPPGVKADPHGRTMGATVPGLTGRRGPR